VEVPTVAVQYTGLSIGATVHVGGRALPSVLNAYRNAIEVRSHRAVAFLDSICSSPEIAKGDESLGL
jgi:hypothetical protein